MSRSRTAATVMRMELFNVFDALNSNGITFVRQAHEHFSKAPEIINRWKMDSRKLRAIVRLGRRLFKPAKDLPTEELDFLRKAIDSAQGLSLDVLLLIDKHVAKLQADVGVGKHELRLELTQAAHNIATYNAIDAHCRHRVSTLNARSIYRPCNSVHISQPDADNQIHIIARADADRIRPFLDLLERETEQAFRAQETHTRAQIRGEVFLNLLTQGKTNGDSALQPHIVVTLNQIGLDGQLNDGTYAVTDGTIHRAVNETLAPHGFISVLDDEKQPLYMGRIIRSAHIDQRLALAAQQILCAGPGCHRQARMLEAHHIHEWHKGGNTDINNLVMVCREHHKLITQGRAEIYYKQGKAIWRDKIRNIEYTNEHPVLQYSGSNLLNTTGEQSGHHEDADKT
ncbi:HNH endonuclease [Corynebacterium sp. sy039]|nr:HNH endonuclease [Corynebacterium sp. sy039]